MNKVVYIKNGLVKYEDYKEILNELEDKVKECKLKDKEIERLNKEIIDLKEQIVSAIRFNNLGKEQASLVEEQAKIYEQEITIIKEKQLKEEIERLNNIINKARKYLTSYESTNTIQQCETPENNKGLDKDTIIEMTNRHIKVHNKLLDILELKEDK